MMHPTRSHFEPKNRIPYRDNDTRVSQDDAELEASGYTREMPRQFSMFSLLALAYALICTWNGFASALGNGLRQGSSSGSIFMLIPAASVIAIISLGMAELTSAFPVAGGQYYWAFILAPPRYAPFLSYSTAVISVIGIWLGGASTCNFISGMILSIAQFIYPNYVIQAWHKYFVYITVILTAASVNIYGARRLPALNRFTFWFSMGTFFVTMALMLYFSYPNYNSAQWVFTDTTISSGWDSHILAWLLCLVNSLYGFLGTDAGVHMTEEIPNPSVNGPKVIMYPVLIGLLTGEANQAAAYVLTHKTDLPTVLPFACVCMFVIKDLDEILNAPSGLPLIQLYHQATGSRAITVMLMVAFTFCFFACAVANVTGSSRSLWSAARDECFPRSDILKKINPRFEMPANAVFLQTIFSIVYGLVFLGSETAFSLMVSASVIFLVGSYIVPQAILVFVGREKLLPERPFNLGKFGYAVNVTSTLSAAVLLVACCLPTEYPITASNMNYNRCWLKWELTIHKMNMSLMSGPPYLLPGNRSDLLNGSFVTESPWLFADQIQPQAPLKILMLHGHGQSGQKFYYKTRIFHAAIQKEILSLTNKPVEFVYLDAPICQIPGDYDTRILVYGSYEESGVRGLNDSIQHIMSVIQNKGPSIGIMGFSTGAALAVIIASLLENPNRHTEFNVKVQQPPLQFVVAYSGFMLGHPIYKSLYYPKIQVPILHLVGKLDCMIAEPLTLRLAQQCQIQKVRYFGGGHFISRHSEMISEVAGFIGDSLVSRMISKTGDN
ncbi:amino acid permease [Aspergillus affinis]|uniref:amino acid permease n=1 Tax=Aspergillus affinis TaxID=1070780 RepID=UPI0022FDD7F5|nr:amino acid permease [Aspergillus affinis]KAI9036782.1 amino acid permease [Aspergillus affinis]